MSEGRNKWTEADEVAFADGVLKALPSVAVPPELEARILADFDAVAAKRAPGAFSRFVRRWQDMVWPGAPAWKPASVLALSLIIGLTAGAFVPASALTSNGQATTTSTTTSTTPPPVLDMSGDF